MTAALVTVATRQTATPEPDINRRAEAPLRDTGITTRGGMAADRPPQPESGLSAGKDTIAVPSEPLARPETGVSQPLSPWSDHRSANATLPAHEAPHPREIARQLAVALPSLEPGGTTELRLDPAELGAVRMTIQASDGSVILAVQAERPETADLMRRHMGELAQELRALGYAEVNLSVTTGQKDSSHRDPEPAPAGGATGTADPDDALPANAVPSRPGLLASAGLDLRL